MQWIKQHKSIMISGGVILLVLLATFLFGGPSTSPSPESGIGEPGISEDTTAGDLGTTGKAGVDTTEAFGTVVNRDMDSDKQSESGENTETATTASAQKETIQEAGTEDSKETTTASVTEATTETTTEVTTEATTEQATITCTISISCATILNNMDSLDPAKKDLIPADGVILSETEVTLKEGQTVYDALRSVCKDAGILVDATYSPVNSSTYVRGIQNIYEFDCGSLSGWKYSVNGVYANYGCSSYILKDGDVIRWNYTCAVNDV